MNCRWRICERGMVIPVLIGGLAMLIAGCGHRRVNLFALDFGMDSTGRKSITATQPFAMDSTGVKTAGPCAATVPDTMHQFSDSIREVLTQNDYCTYQISEYHDVQPLRVNDIVSYGPVAWTFASPLVANYTGHKVFDNLWLNVAIIKVDEEPSATLPPEYRWLHLHGGFNCLFLYHDHSQTAPHWRAAMVRPKVDYDCGTVTITDQDTLSVLDEQPFPKADDYPPVTRFMESTETRTFIGVRCGDRWCAVGAKWPYPLKSSLDGVSGVGKSARWHVKGWFDEQHLAVADASNHMRPQQLGVLIPSDSLSLFDSTAYATDWKLVAAVYFPDAPAGKYGDKSAAGYGWTQGFNKVWLRSNVVQRPTAKDTVIWTTVFGEDPKTAVHIKQVVQTDHSKEGLPVPWTARWRWVAGDEQMWVACLAGCCMVKPKDN